MERTQAFLDANAITQTELGEALGVQGAAISRKLKGTRKWSLDEIQQALGWLSRRVGRPVAFDEVFGEADVVAAPADAAPNSAA